MSLTKQDLTDIRSVLLDALDAVVNPRFDRVEAQLDEHSKILNEHSQILADHGRRLVAIEQKVDNLDGQLRAIEADVKELYATTGKPLTIAFDNKLSKLLPEQQLRKLHTAIVSLAKQPHVEL